MAALGQTMRRQATKSLAQNLSWNWNFIASNPVSQYLAGCPLTDNSHCTRQCFSRFLNCLGDQSPSPQNTEIAARDKDINPSDKASSCPNLRHSEGEDCTLHGGLVNSTKSNSKFLLGRWQNKEPANFNLSGGFSHSYASSARRSKGSKLERLRQGRTARKNDAKLGGQDFQHPINRSSAQPIDRSKVREDSVGIECSQLANEQGPVQQSSFDNQAQSSVEGGLQETGEKALVEPKPATDAQVATVLKHPALIVTRDIEWGTVIFGFEQQNKYTVLDQDGNVVALLAEDSGGFGQQVGRQLLRTRRKFSATILSPEGDIILRLRRPAYLINSTIHIENAHGEQIGEVKQRWHLWQRNYDVYLDRRQIAAINSPLLAWEFALKDESGGVLALIDRNFQGFGKELFTDAGKYVIHFGDNPLDAAEQVANTVQASHPDKPRPDVTKLAQFRTDVAVIPTATGNQLEVARPLSIDERTLVLATAVSIDFDYFSQHSHGPGFMPWLMPIPMPMPDYPPPEGGVNPDAGPISPNEASEPNSQTDADPAQTLDSGEGPFEQGNSGQRNDEPGFGEDTWGNENEGWDQGDDGFDVDSGEGGSLWDSITDAFDGFND